MNGMIVGEVKEFEGKLGEFKRKGRGTMIFKRKL